MTEHPPEPPEPAADADTEPAHPDLELGEKRDEKRVVPPVLTGTIKVGFRTDDGDLVIGTPLQYQGGSVLVEYTDADGMVRTTWVLGTQIEEP